MSHVEKWWWMNVPEKVTYKVIKLIVTQNAVKVINGDWIQNPRYLSLKSKGVVFTRKGTYEPSGGAGRVLYVDLSGGHTG